MNSRLWDSGRYRIRSSLRPAYRQRSLSVRRSAPDNRETRPNAPSPDNNFVYKFFHERRQVAPDRLTNEVIGRDEGINHRGGTMRLRKTAYHIVQKIPRVGYLVHEPVTAKPLDEHLSNK